MAKKLKPGQKRCPSCAASVSGPRTKTCPKCGHEFNGKPKAGPSFAAARATVAPVEPTKNGGDKPQVNKTQAVRDYLKDHPDAQNKDIAAALTEQGIEITPQHVAAIKTKLNQTRKVRRLASPVTVVQPPAPAPTAPAAVEKPARDGNAITVDQIRKVAQTVKAIGGFQRMTELLEVIKEAGGVKKFKELAEAMTVPGQDAVVL